MVLDRHRHEHDVTSVIDVKNIIAMHPYILYLKNLKAIQN